MLGLQSFEGRGSGKIVAKAPVLALWFGEPGFHSILFLLLLQVLVF